MSTMIINLYKYLENLIEDEYDKSNKSWNSESLFYKIKWLTIDQRGRVGEHFFKEVFENLNKEVFYEENAHGDWDLVVNGYKIEIKTATLDVNNKFQHEGIKENKKWDFIAFLDISPNEVYVSFIPNTQFEFNIRTYEKLKEKIKGTFFINGKKYNSHFRGKDNSRDRATGAGYKVDLKQKDLILTRTIKDIEISFDKAIEEFERDKKRKAIIKQEFEKVSYNRNWIQFCSNLKYRINQHIFSVWIMKQFIIYISFLN